MYLKVLVDVVLAGQCDKSPNSLHGIGSLSEVAQVIIFHTFYGTWRFIPLAHVQGHTIQSTSFCSHSFKVFLILSSHVYLDIKFFHKNTVCIAVHSHACYMLSLFYPLWFHQPHTYGNYKPHYVVFFIFPLLPNRAIYSQHRKHSQSVFVLCEQPNFIPIKNCRESYSFENCFILGYYAVCNGNSLLTFWENLAVQWDWWVVHCKLHNSPEKCSSHLLHAGSLKSCKL